MVLAEAKAKCTAEVEVQPRMRRAATLSLLVQRRETTVTGKDDQLREDEALVGAEGLSSVTVVISWDINLMIVRRGNQQAEEEPILPSQRMQKKHLRKLRTHLR